MQLNTLARSPTGTAVAKRGDTLGGVETLIHYPVPPHRQDAYRAVQLPQGSLPVAERLAQQVLSLPMGPHLLATDAERVIAVVNQALR